MKAIRSCQHSVSAGPRARTLAAAGTVAVGLAAAAAFGPGVPAALAALPVSTPAITVADGNSVIAVQTSDDGLRFYWNQSGTTTWRGEPVAASGTTFSAPSIAADGNGVIITAQGVNHTLVFYWQQIGAPGWQAETVAGPGSTYSAPSMTVNGGVNIVAQGPADSLDFYRPSPAPGRGTCSGSRPRARPIPRRPSRRTGAARTWSRKGRATDGPPAITADTDGSTDGVDVVAPAAFDRLGRLGSSSGKTTFSITAR